MAFDFGNRLRQLRLEKGYSQEYLAEVLKISQKTYSNIENNKSTLSLERLKTIAEEYQIDLFQLLYDGNEGERKNASTVGLLPKNGFQAKPSQNVSEELIAQMKERIEEFKYILYEKNKQIELLQKKLNT